MIDPLPWQPAKKISTSISPKSWNIYNKKWWWELGCNAKSLFLCWTFEALTFLNVLMATVSIKLAVEKSNMMEWMSQVHFPRDPKETLSRSLLKVSSLLESSVVVSPSCRSDTDPRVAVSGSVPFRYIQVWQPSDVRAVSGITNTVLFSLSLKPSSTSLCMSPLTSSPTVKTDFLDRWEASLRALFCKGRMKVTVHRFEQINSLGVWP